MKFFFLILVSTFVLAESAASQIEPDEICPAEWVALGGLEGTSGIGCSDFSVTAFVAVLKDGECEDVGPCHILEPAYVDIEFTGSGSPWLYDINMAGSIYPPPPPNQYNIFHVRIYGDSPCNDDGTELRVDIEIYLITQGGPALICTGWNTMVCNQCQLEGE